MGTTSSREGRDFEAVRPAPGQSSRRAPRALHSHNRHNRSSSSSSSSSSSGGGGGGGGGGSGGGNSSSGSSSWGPAVPDTMLRRAAEMHIDLDVTAAIWDRFFEAAMARNSRPRSSRDVARRSSTQELRQLQWQHDRQRQQPATARLPSSAAAIAAGEPVLQLYDRDFAAAYFVGLVSGATSWEIPAADSGDGAGSGVVEWF